MSRPIRATIDVDALRHNLGVARAHAGAARVLAVAKAAAYGHRLAHVLPALREADGIAVLDLADAIAIRESGFDRRIVLLEGCFHAGDLLEAARHRLHVVVHDAEQVRMLQVAPPTAPVGVLLKCNSGMNRLGFRVTAFRQALVSLQALPSVADITLMTHFADAERADGIDAACDEFEAACDGSVLPRSAANSAALVAHPRVRGDWVRPGIILYGASPFDDRSADDLGLRPVMTLRSQVIAIQTLSPGDRVGYGGQFVADRAMRIGVVACGYADGYPRHAPTGTPMLVDGVRTRTVGRVSMDMITVDLTPVPSATIGSPVTLWGRGLSVDEVARSAGTVGYELLCALAPRVSTVVEPPER